MAIEQVIVNKAIPKAVAEMTKVAKQAIAMATMERPHGMTRPRMGGPTMKQPNFNWEAEDKYNKLKMFRLEVNNILK